VFFRSGRSRDYGVPCALRPRLTASVRYQQFDDGCGWAALFRFASRHRQRNSFSSGIARDQAANRFNAPFGIALHFSQVRQHSGVCVHQFNFARFRRVEHIDEHAPCKNPSRRLCLIVGPAPEGGETGISGCFRESDKFGSGHGHTLYLQQKVMQVFVAAATAQQTFDISIVESPFCMNHCAEPQPTFSKT
jgi:hypothetical protein